MSIKNLGEGLAQTMERIEHEKKASSAQEIVLDDTNQVSFPGYPYKFEALGEKILVSIDVFKSGYECKECGGKGRIKYECPCTKTDRPGFKYSSSQLDDIIEAFGESLGEARGTQECPECKGDPKSVSRDESCSTCHGRGALLVMPETSKNLPVTGIVVSMGSDARKQAAFKIGDRILFGPYAGTMIPTKAGLMFKYMDWTAASLKIEGADDMNAFDFILQEE